MKIFYLFIFVVFLVGFVSSCVTEPTYRRYEYIFVDTSCAISENDSLIWKQRNPVSEEDTLHVEIQSHNLNLGYVIVKTGEEGDYKEIFREDTTYGINKYFEIGECDTFAIIIVNTFLSDTLNINLKIEIIYWSPEY